MNKLESGFTIMEPSKMTNVLLIDGKILNTGVYTCIWNGELWKVIITEHEMPENDSVEELDLVNALALAVEGALGVSE